VLFDGLRMPVDTQRKMQIDPKGVTFESSHVRRVAMPVFLQNTRMFSKYASIGRGPDGIGSISMKTSLGRHRNPLRFAPHIVISPRD